MALTTASSFAAHTLCSTFMPPGWPLKYGWMILATVSKLVCLQQLLQDTEVNSKSCWHSSLGYSRIFSTSLLFSPIVSPSSNSVSHTFVESQHAPPRLSITLVTSSFSPSRMIGVTSTMFFMLKTLSRFFPFRARAYFKKES